jgi:predicted transcriptional regulator
VKNSDRFLNAFREIERHLYRLTGADAGTAFSRVVKDAAQRDTAVGRYTDDLFEFAELRNAIVHRKRGDEVIAEPNDQGVADIERIAHHLTKPPTVIPLFQGRVLTVLTGDSIGIAVKAMFDEQYSQAPVYDQETFVGLLTTNTIARWLGACVEEDLLSLEETTVAQVLQHTEDKENHCFLSRDATLFEALDRFQTYQAKGKKLEALLLTQSGKPGEKLLGIITIWDLPRIHEVLRRS